MYTTVLCAMCNVMMTVSFSFLGEQILGHVAVVQPYDACRPLQNPRDLEGKIGLLERGSCMFMDKVIMNGFMFKYW